MLLTLDSSLHKPLYLQIRDQIRERILGGALRVGDRLEPSRELAKRLGVHRTTVGNAYAELESEGLIEGTVGRGTFVSTFAARLRTRAIPPRRSANDFLWDSFFVEETRGDALGRLMASASAWHDFVCHEPRFKRPDSFGDSSPRHGFSPAEGRRGLASSTDRVTAMHL